VVCGTVGGLTPTGHSHVHIIKISRIDLINTPSTLKNAFEECGP
jgi:hypothetical protein